MFQRQKSSVVEFFKAKISKENALEKLSRYVQNTYRLQIGQLELLVPTLLRGEVMSQIFIFQFYQHF